MSAQCYVFGVGIACGAEIVEFKVIFFFQYPQVPSDAR